MCRRETRPRRNPGTVSPITPAQRPRRKLEITSRARDRGTSTNRIAAPERFQARTAMCTWSRSVADVTAYVTRPPGHGSPEEPRRLRGRRRAPRTHHRQCHDERAPHPRTSPLSSVMLGVPRPPPLGELGDVVAATFEPHGRVGLCVDAVLVPGDVPGDRDHDVGTDAAERHQRDARRAERARDALHRPPVGARVERLQAERDGVRRQLRPLDLARLRARRGGGLLARQLHDADRVARRRARGVSFAFFSSFGRRRRSIRPARGSRGCGGGRAGRRGASRASAPRPRTARTRAVSPGRRGTSPRSPRGAACARSSRSARPRADVPSGPRPTRILPPSSPPRRPSARCAAEPPRTAGSSSRNRPGRRSRT